MKILYVASEVAPFAKTGGLADVSAALPRHLHERGHDVRLFVPLYRRVQQSGLELESVPGLESLTLRLGPHSIRYGVVRGTLPGSNLAVHFIRCAGLYDREGIYTGDHDEHLRFLVLSFAAIEACQHMGFSPDIAHAHDWQSALIPLALNARYAWDRQRFGGTKTVLTIHNLAHQGAFGAHILPETGMLERAHLFHQDQLHAGVINFLLHGILYADAITTVSPTYAHEICTPELGMGLDSFLRARAGRLVGVLNGIDDAEWSPERDELIPKRYGIDSIDDKEENKRALLTRLGLPYVPRVAVAGVVSRLSAQKGHELILESISPYLARGHLQLVVLGSGAESYERGYANLQRRFPRSVCFYRGFSNELAHLIEAGSDLFLMPSRFEPCGLNQMYSLRYGTPPLVHRTGGLADTVVPFEAPGGRGTGFVFEHFSRTGFCWALEQALRVWPDRGRWRALQAEGMRHDFSWARRGAAYEALYRLTLSL